MMWAVNEKLANTRKQSSNVSGDCAICVFDYHWQHVCEDQLNEACAIDEARSGIRAVACLSSPLFLTLLALDLLLLLLLSPLVPARDLKLPLHPLLCIGRKAQQPQQGRSPLIPPSFLLGQSQSIAPHVEHSRLNLVHLPKVCENGAHAAGSGIA